MQLVEGSALCFVPSQATGDTLGVLGKSVLDVSSSIEIFVQCVLCPLLCCLRYVGVADRTGGRISVKVSKDDGS